MSEISNELATAKRLAKVMAIPDAVWPKVAALLAYAEEREALQGRVDELTRELFTRISEQEE